jgi:uncharacterized membrane protein
VALGIAVAAALPWALRSVVPALAAALPVTINLALALGFAASLRRGREPLIARFARAERGVLPPDLAAYTRRLTWVWVGFFAVAAGVSALLWLRGDARAWLAFTMAGNYAAVAALFIGEYAYRRWRFRRYEHAPPLAMLGHVAAVLRGRSE